MTDEPETFDTTCPAKAMGGKTGDELRWSETWLCELPKDPPHVNHQCGDFVWRFES